MTRIKALLVGLGQIGCGYDLDKPFCPDRPYSGSVTWTHARALTCHPQVELVAAIDPSPYARERFSAVYACPTFEDLSACLQGLAHIDFDLVVVAIPPTLQPTLVEQLLSRCSPRMLLLEKPLAINALGAERLLTACMLHPNMVVAVNYTRRYLPVVLEFQSQLRCGSLGQFLHGRLVYGKGLLSNGSHFVNLAEAWLGPLIRGDVSQGGSAFAGFDQEASLQLIALNHNGAVLDVRSIGQAGLRAGELDLWFSQGRLLWSNDGRSIHLWRLAEPAPGDSYRPLMADSEVIPSGIEHYQHHVVDNLVRHCQLPAEVSIHCDLNAGLRTLQLLQDALNVSR